MAITMLAGYLVIINAAALLMMAEDKRRAKRHQWRVPEAVLFGAALLAAAPGHGRACICSTTKPSTGILWWVCR